MRFAAARWAMIFPAAVEPVKPVRKRAKLFTTLHDLMLDRHAEALDLIQFETGKSRLHALEEILDGVGSTLYYARRAPKLLAPKRRAGAIPLFTQTREVYHPKGVVTTITPWNYPLALTMDVVPALLAGNAVVHKPDNETALSSLWPRMLLIEAGLPADLWQVTLGGPADIGNTLIDNADFVAPQPMSRSLSTEREPPNASGRAFPLGNLDQRLPGKGSGGSAIHCQTSRRYRRERLVGHSVGRCSTSVIFYSWIPARQQRVGMVAGVMGWDIGLVPECLCCSPPRCQTGVISEMRQPPRCSTRCG
ncbi:aldehyde dehydrogenase family protein [Nocardia fusca]|uniref:aldehyde dehydrogenase family protein n=1 Tax=Nocardia fusca TaxID=941183 RepID=UPI00379DB7BC